MLDLNSVSEGNCRARIRVVGFVFGLGRVGVGVRVPQRKGKIP